MNGSYVEMEEVWPQCAGSPIDATEAEHLAGLQRWGEQAGHAALADPRKRLSPLQSPMMF